MEGDARMRKLRTLLVGVALAAAVGAPASVGAVSANNPKAEIQYGNFFCGADHPELPVAGFVNFHRSGNTVRLNVHIKHGLPKNDYLVQLWSGACVPLGSAPATVTTNRKGVANANVRFAVPGAVTTFFATLLDADGPVLYSDTTIVTLD